MTVARVEIAVGFAAKERVDLVETRDAVDRAQVNRRRNRFGRRKRKLDRAGARVAGSSRGARSRSSDRLDVPAGCRQETLAGPPAFRANRAAWPSMAIISPTAFNSLRGFLAAFASASARRWSAKAVQSIDQA